MALRTVRVPAEMQPLFEQAEAVVSEYFHDQHARPDEGTIEIFGERYLLVRGASLSVEFFALARDLLGEGRQREADDFARNLLYDLAHAIGKADAKDFHAKMGLEEPIARLSAGPVHFAHTGWASVDISPESVPAAGEDFYLLYDHPYSFESDAWRRAGKHAEFPVCTMNAGYSSGWCSESFGLPLIAAEILCRGRGDDTCRFIMAPPDQIERHVQRYVTAQPDLAPYDAAGKIPEFFSRKRLEDELRQAKEELEERVERRTAELREANERLKEEMAARAEIEVQLVQSQKLEALGRLAGGVAHDFNNILTAICGYSDLLLAELPSDNHLTGFALEITRSAKRAADLTNQLLVFSRQRVIAPSVLDLGEVVTGMGDMLQRLIGETVGFDARLSEDPCCVRMDLGRLEQVIVNLTVNARDAMPEGGDVILEVRADETSDEAILRVEDSGEGIDEETLERLFDPFFTTKPEGRGTGLGLATVYGIVQQSGGTVEVSSTPDVGSVFEVRFPRVHDLPDVVGKILGVTGRPPEGRSVLLVEDEEIVRRLVRLLLERSGFDVHEARDAQEALALVEERAEEIDLLLTDVIMPGMGGVELARELRGRKPDMKVVFISGSTDNRISPEAQAETGGAFIQKPFTMATLEARLREILE